MTSPHALLLEGDEVRQIPAADLFRAILWYWKPAARFRRILC